MQSPRHPYAPRQAPGPQRGANLFKTHWPEDPAAPKSSAWLQAEQLFAAAPAPAPDPDATPVDVKVKRSRFAPPDAAGSLPGQHADTAAASEKAPRVFRVETPASESAPDPDPAETTPVPAAAAPPLRTRRLADERRPGPVLQLFTAPPAEPLDLEEAAALRHMLAVVNPLLADVERAKAFHFIDEALVTRWSTVTQAIAQLHADVSTLAARSLRAGAEEDVAA